MDRFRGCCHNADCDGFENCDDCWNDYKANHQMTNAQKIRAMSDEVLSDYIDCPYYVHPDMCINERSCYDCKLEWLKQPYKEDA